MLSQALVDRFEANQRFEAVIPVPEYISIAKPELLNMAFQQLENCVEVVSAQGVLSEDGVA